MHSHKKAAADSRSAKMHSMGLPMTGHPTGDGASLSEKAPVYREGRFGDDEPMDAGSKLGPAPLNPRQFKSGGAVHGEHAKGHLGRMGRKKGGRTGDGSDLLVKGERPYRKGGAVHEDEKEDKKLIHSEMKKAGCFADGGSVGGGGKKKSGKTTVNVIIAPQGQGQGQPTPVPVPIGPPPGPPPMPPRPPMAGPPMMPPGAPGLGAAGMPPSIPAGAMARKSGGSVKSFDGPENGGEKVPMTAGAMSGEGRLQKVTLQKRGLNQKLIHAK